MCVLIFVCDGQLGFFHSISVYYDGQFRLVRLFNLLGNGRLEARLLYYVFYCPVTFVFLSSILMARLGSLFVTHSITMAKCWLVRVYRCPNKDRSQGASLLRCPGFGSFVYYTTQIDDDHLRFVRRILTSQLRWPVSARSLA